MTSTTRRCSTVSSRSSPVTYCEALSNAVDCSSRCAFSSSSCAVWIASPTSRATDSRSVCSETVHWCGSLRCSPKTPIMRSKTRIGVPIVALVPSARRLSMLPRVGSASSGASSMSATATVRRSRAARFRTGRLGASPPTGAVPGATHSASTGIGSPASPRRMKARLRGRRLRRLLDRHAQDVVQVELRANLARHLADDPLAFERLRERGRGLGPLDRQRRLARERLERRDLLLGEQSRSLRRGRSEYGVHAPRRDQRHEHGALGADALGQTATHARGGGDVVDEDRRGLEHGRRDRGGLPLEVDGHLAPPVGLDTVLQSDEAARAPAVIADQRDRGQVDPEPGDHLLDEEQARGPDVGRAQQGVGERLVRLVVGCRVSLVPTLGPAAAKQ